ncbi:MAG: hypothetical protein QM607_01385 [Microbacterium sp.]
MAGSARATMLDVAQLAGTGGRAPDVAIMHAARALGWTPGGLLDTVASSSTTAAVIRFMSPVARRCLKPTRLSEASRG